MEGDTVKPDGANIEQRLLTLCAQALSVEAVSVGDNFFELGGDSLSAMWLLSGIQDEFRLEIPLTELFDAQTMKDVIAVIERHLDDGSPTAGATPEASGR